MGIANLLYKLEFRQIHNTYFNFTTFSVFSLIIDYFLVMSYFATRVYLTKDMAYCCGARVMVAVEVGAGATSIVWPTTAGCSPW